MNITAATTKSSRIRRYSLILLAAWTLLVICSLVVQIRQHRKESLTLGRMQAQAFFEKDILYRRWASRHGGVYVPVTDSTRPNPYLSHVPERDITTPSGKQLTLMNPAYMTRQVFEMAQEYTGSGRGHITSLKPIRAENAPDPWELRTLQAFEHGIKEFGELSVIDGKPYYRYMKSLIAEKPCLKCHEAQGYREGSVRGGLSVSVAMEPFNAMMRTSARQEYVTHATVWLLLAGFIGFGSRKLEKSDHHIRKQAETLKIEKERSEQYLNVAQVIMVVFDDQARITLINRKGYEVLGYAEGELVGKDWFRTCLPPEEYEPVAAVYRQLMAGKLQPVDYYENYVLTKHGEKRLIAWRNTHLKDETGRITGTLSSGEDITEKRKAENDLHESTILLEEEIAERQITQEALQEQTAILEEEIEERQRAEAELQQSAMRLQLATAAGHMGVWDWNVKTNTMVWDDRMFELYGITRENSPVCTEAWLSSLHPDDKNRVMIECHAALDGHAIYDTEYRVVHQNGAVRHLKANAVVLRDADGTADRMLGVNYDITEQKEWTDALMHRLELLSNPATDISAIGFGDLFNVAEIQKIQDSFALATGVASIITDTDGLPITKPSNFSDLCLHIIRNTEKGLANCHRSDAVLGRFNPGGPVMQPCLSGGLLDGGAAIHVGDKHVANWLIGQVLDESCDTEKMMAYAREIGADEEQYRAALAKVTRMPAAQFEKICNALFCIAGQLSEMAIQNVNQAQHIGERKRSEEIIRTSEAKFAKAFENAPLMMSVSKVEDGTYIDVNLMFCTLSGFSREEVIGRTSTELNFITVSDRQRLIDELRRNGRVAGMELVLHTKYGKPLLVSYHGELIAIGAEQHLLSIGQNITEHRHLEAQLRQSQKMEAIGQLAGGVAHDFNNILTVIMGYANLLELGAPLDPRQKEAAEQIITSAEKASQLTKGLLAFSRKQALATSNTNLNDVVHHVEKFLVRIIGEDIQFKSIYTGQNIPVCVDSSQIEQALINLATNARDAMSKGGSLTLETSIQQIDVPFADGSGTPGRYACITVSDTGSGMDSETCSRIFEPFFTTKEVGKGTGLGMAIVFGIIKQHNGFINVYSEPEVGTTFRMYLPLVDENPGAPVEIKAPTVPQGGSETILLAEDDANVRDLVTTVLRQFGYTVIQAEDGQDAVEKFTGNQDRINLLLMDIIMPKKNGKEAFEEISTIKPGVKVLFSSGYTADFIESRGVAEKDIELIMKPAQPMELLRKVREILDR